jgi:propionate CoA-transferase
MRSRATPRPISSGRFSTRPNRDKQVDASEAVRLIRDDDAVVVGGFVGACFAEELTLALEERILATGARRDLTLIFTVAAGDLKSRGLDQLAHSGLVRRAIGGHSAAAAALQKLAVEGEIEAYNLPLGCISQMFRDAAGNKPRSPSPMGLGTSVGPRHLRPGVTDA